MKNILLSLVFTGAIFLGVSSVYASSGVISFPITVNACVANANPPTASVGPNQTIYQPTSSATITSSGTGCPTWYVIFYPGATSPTIQNPNSLTTQVTGLTTVGAYGFGVTYINSAGQTASALTQVIVAAPGPDLIASMVTPSSATRTVATTMQATITNQGSVSTGSSSFTNIFQFDADSNHSSGVTSQPTTTSALAAGASVTTSTSYTFNTIGTWYVRACADNDASFNGTVPETDEANNCSTSWTAVTVSPNSADNGSCSAIHYACISGTSTNNVNGASQWTWTCAGSNGGSDAQCTENKPVVNGSCAATHYNCTAGTATSQASTPTQYTWICAGSGGGVNSSQCTEAIVGTPQCADGIDNDGDGKIDLADPGCTNATDNSEANPKPIFIDF